MTDLVAAGLLAPEQVGAAEAELPLWREARATTELREELVRTREQLAAARDLVDTLTADKVQLSELLRLTLKGRA